MESRPPPSEWVDRYGDALYSFAYFRTGNQVEAEDAVQETFLRGLRKVEGFEGRSSLKTWLTAILKNVLRETDRRKGRESKHVAERERDSSVLSPSELQALPPDKAVEREEFWEAVEACLEQLPVKSAKVFWAREVEKTPTGEVASVEGVSENYVWVLLHRARKIMRQCLTRVLGLNQKCDRD